jgi:protein-L-isoaspartate(D-aspartate) O-methyltransferase
MTMIDDPGVAEALRFFAEEIRFAAPVERDEVVEAFASVRRERFLGPAPWKFGTLEGRYRVVPGSDPCSTYHNVVFAIDERRRLNNGQPSFLGRLIDESGAAPGHHVVHVGCGTGYYSAVLAELVGEGGRVTAIELDEDLAARARRNLADFPNVEVKQADGTIFDAGAANAILVNAGSTHPASVWLDRLLPGANLILPLTVNAPVHGGGWVLKVTQGKKGLAARFISPVGIYHCAGARDEALSRRLGHAYARGDEARKKVRSLRRDEHSEGDGCWLHTDEFCLSNFALD